MENIKSQMWIMTELLEKAFKEVSKLPETDQNAIAKWLLEELKGEKNGKKLLRNPKKYLIALLTKLLSLTKKPPRQNEHIPEDHRPLPGGRIYYPPLCNFLSLIHNLKLFSYNLNLLQ